MFSMFSRTGAPTKRGPTGQQLDIFWLVRASLWCVETFKSSLGAARHCQASGICIRRIARSRDLNFTTLRTDLFTDIKFREGPRIFAEQGLVGVKSGPAYTCYSPPPHTVTQIKRDVSPPVYHTLFSCRTSLIP